MYVKIFQSIYDGSLIAGPHAWEAIDTLMHLLVLADKDGIVDMTPTAIHARTQVPVDFLERGIAELEKPDPDSRNPAEDGRRIVRLDDHRSWGWQIVNHKFYRDLRKAEDRKEYFRIKKQEYREREQASTHVNNCQQSSTDVHTCPHMSTMSTEAEAVSSKQKKEKTLVQNKVLNDDAFNKFYQAYPKHEGKQEAKKAWAKMKPTPELTEIMLASIEIWKTSEKWREGFVPMPATWLNGKRWEDEVPLPRHKKGELKSCFS